MLGDCLVGIDIGGTVAKALVFAPDGRTLGIGTGSVPVVAAHPGWSEVDTAVLWAQTAFAVREALARSGRRASDVAAVGLSGSGNGLCIAGASGEVLRPMIRSSDIRAHEIVAEWNAAGLGDELRPIIRQGLWPGQPLALLAWLRRHEPRTFHDIRSVLLCKDWIRHELTGDIHADVTDATAAGLSHVATETYSRRALEVLGLGEVFDSLPPIAPRASVAGRVTKEAAEITGLAEGTPVAGGLFDCAAAALGVGCIDAGQVCLIVGTWSISEVVISEPVLAPSVGFTTSHAVPGRWLLLEASATSATNLSWYLDELAAAERIEAQRRGVPIYTILDEKLRTVAPGSEGVVFHPYVHGSLTNPAARAAFVGIGAWHHRSHLLRAVYEGVAFSHLEHLNRLRAVVPISEARLTGGGSRSPVWCQMLADVFGVTLIVPSSAESGALGAAIDAGIAVGLYSEYSAAVEQTQRAHRHEQLRYEPDPGTRPAYERAHRFFRETTAALEPIVL